MTTQGDLLGLLLFKLKDHEDNIIENPRTTISRLLQFAKHACENEMRYNRKSPIHQHFIQDSIFKAWIVVDSHRLKKYGNRLKHGLMCLT